MRVVYAHVFAAQFLEPDLKQRVEWVGDDIRSNDCVMNDKNEKRYSNICDLVKSLALFGVFVSVGRKSVSLADDSGKIINREWLNYTHQREKGFFIS